MFTALQHSEEECLDPKSFCNAFKDLSGNPINIFEQMDVDEFTNILFDRLENQLKGCRNFINDHFGGVMANEIICKDCPHSSEKEEPFLSISLEVKNKRQIYQSLEALVKGELLEGENAYECDTCKKKVSAIKRVSLKKLPNHLIIVLKRLEFNYDSMVKIKLNDFCEFPVQLDLRQFSQQHLHTI
jgi:ubiquitin carboxyl-terminal hydrolase 9/24